MKPSLAHRTCITWNCRRKAPHDAAAIRRGTLPLWDKRPPHMGMPVKCVTPAKGLSEMQHIQQQQSRDEVRRAFRSALAAVLNELMRQKRCTQMNLSGVTGLSRTTIGTALAGGGRSGTSTRCDTLADMIWGLGGSVQDFTFRLMLKASSQRLRGAPGAGGGELEIRLGEFILCVRLHHVPKT